MKCDAVFEGGGVKGIGLVGATAIAEQRGYQFENVAGTSAGAIVGALVAAGYTAAELKAIMDSLDYNNFKDKGTLDRIPLIGPVLSLGFEKGIFEGRFVEEWMRDLLAQKNVRTFGDLVIEEYKDDPRFRYRLQVIASDVSRGKMLALPRDIVDYGHSPEGLEVARAVRMSMSIPFFFEPVIERTADGAACYIVDGGILSNYPIWLLNDGSDNPPWPTFGYKLVEPETEISNPINGPITLLAALFATMMEAHDARYIEDSHFALTIPIPTMGVKTTEFDLSKERSEALYQSGVKAAEDFFTRWDFAAYKSAFRQKAAASRRASVWGRPG